MKKGLDSNKEDGVILAIIGSRLMTDELLLNETLERFVLEYGMPKQIVSGGAKGADTMGEKWGYKHNVPVISLRPKWRVNGVYDKSAGIKRNTDIVKKCTHMIAFPSTTGKGTQDSIRKAKAAGKQIVIKFID